VYSPSLVKQFCAAGSDGGQMDRGVRVIALLILWFIPGTILYTAFSSGWAPVWLNWNVPSIVPSFIDLRSITAGLETERHGGDALVANPYDPKQRPLNYPRFWLYLFSALHINDQNLPIVGLFFCSLYLLCMSILIVGGKSSIEATLLLVAGLSWAALVALERGNNDLFVFAVVFWGCMSRRESLKLSAYSLAALLKIFPLVALIVHAIWKSARERIAPLVITAATAGVFLFQLRDINAIRRGTPTDVWLSYGILSLKQQALLANGLTAGIVVLFCCWLLIVVTVRNAWIRGPHFDSSILKTKTGEMFVVFGGIYAFSFMAGSNYDYRLIFLLPTIPFALELIRGKQNALLGCVYVGLLLLAENPLGLRPRYARYETIAMDVATFSLAMIVLTILTALGKDHLAKGLTNKAELASTPVNG
jgi:hypothetical protein